MASYPQPLLDLIDALMALPGIGPKTAERLALHIVRQSENEAQELATSIASVKKSIRYCLTCFNISQTEQCRICQDQSRQRDLLCVVESPSDLRAIEEGGSFKGLYHCLLGRIAPMDGIREDDLTIPQLVKRCKSGNVSEVILATNPDLGGDATALAVARALAPTGVTVSRLGRGVPVGHHLESLSGSVLEAAFGSRQPIGLKGAAP